MNSDLKNAIRDVLVDGKLPCARAFAVAKEMGVNPLEVGRVATEEGIKISRCQLGLFGYPEGARPVEKMKDKVTDELRKELRSRLVDGQLSCKAAWQIAAELKAAKMLISATAEDLNIRIRDCQLGCFV